MKTVSEKATMVLMMWAYVPVVFQEKESFDQQLLHCYAAILS